MLVTTEAWPQSEWRRLPAHRHELAGDAEEPFSVQWACDRETLDQLLRASGWSVPPPWSWSAALAALAPQTAEASLPVLPRFDRGQASRLVLVRADPLSPGGARLVLRMWSSDFALAAPAAPLPIWYGAVYRERQSVRDWVHRTTVPAGSLPALLPSKPTVAQVLLGSDKPLLLRCQKG